VIFLKLIWSKIGGYLAVAGGAVAFVVGVFLYGRSAGKESAKAAADKKDAKAIKKARGVENEIQGIGDDAVDDRLGKWLRD
jgi:uncharacterized membrane protein